MKKNLWVIYLAMLSTAVWADQRATTPPPAAPASEAQAPTTAPAPAADATTAPAAEQPKPKATTRRRAPRRTAVEPRTTPLVPGPAVVAVSPKSRVMVRGRAGLIGEVIAKATNGQPFTVIEEITLKMSRMDEPSAWAKVVLPSNAATWVNSAHIDADTKTVKAKKLNIRGGPGENYSVLGTLQKGDSVKEVQVKGAWTQIEPPPGTYAFMAAQYLTQDPMILAANTPATPAQVNEPDVPAVPGGTPEMPPASPDAAATEPAPAPAPEEPPPPRVVDREGIVRGTFSIQAPTPYELISPDNGKPINYLFTSSTNLDLSRYKGLRIIVTGEEGLDQRWKNTPVITIQRIQVLQ